MWQGARVFPTRLATILRPPGALRWLLLGGAVVASLLVAQLLTGLRGGSAPKPEPIVENDGGSAFLAQGYAELEQSGYRFASAPSAWDIMASMVAPLVVVIAGAYGTIRGLRYLNRRMARVAGSSGLLEVIETLPLGGSGMLHVVRVGDRVVIVGAGTGGLSLITELSAEEAELVLTRRASEASDGAILTALLPRFRDVLASRSAGTFPAPQAMTPETAAGSRVDDSREMERLRAPSGEGGSGSGATGTAEASQRFGYWPDASV